MSNSKFQRVIEKWLEDPMNKDLKKELEKMIENDSEDLVRFKKLQNDFVAISGQNKIPENPFFFSKLQFRMEEKREAKSHVQWVRWSVYTATMSLSLFLGIMLGNQVESDQLAVTSVQTITDEVFADEFLVADYSIDNTLQIEIEE